MQEVLRTLVLKLVGCPYIWGGSTPWMGFDCSGFIVWIFRVFGKLPSGDWTAQELHDGFAKILNTDFHSVELGDLVFYGGGPGRITHVMLALSSGQVVGASGGGRTTTTIEEARRLGAQVKVKPLNYRSDLVDYARTSELFKSGG
jgi:cell wall-associated NlpC family hydrolase